VIVPDRWTDQWIAAWNDRDLDTLLSFYSDTIQLRSPLAKIYARDGLIRGKIELREYWTEALRRLPNLSLAKVAVYTGHLALTVHYRDNNLRNIVETILFDDREKASVSTVCLDRVR
jgi:ketosteroid isomerase-like protein